MKNKYLILYIITICLLLITIGFTVAKLSSQIQGKGLAIIARPVFKIEKQTPISINADSNEGTYCFKITNKENGKISDVEFLYTIKINNLDDSIKLELYQGENKIELKNNQTEQIKIDRNIEEVHDYKLKINYNKEICSATEDIVGKIDISVDAKQII